MIACGVRTKRLIALGSIGFTGAVEIKRPVAVGGIIAPCVAIKRCASGCGILVPCCVIKK